MGLPADSVRIERIAPGLFRVELCDHRGDPYKWATLAASEVRETVGDYLDEVLAAEGL